MSLDELITREEWAAVVKENAPEPITKRTDLLALRQEKVRMWYAIAGVPRRYRGLEFLEDATVFVGEEAVQQFSKQWDIWYGEISKNGLEGAAGLYLYGAHNSGKTTLAILAMLSACDFLPDGLDPFYLHAGTYVAKRRSLDEVADMWTAKVASAGIFVLDDIGSESSSEYSREQVTTLLESRASNVYPSIFTGNIAPEDLEEVLGGRIAARILRFNRALRI